MAKIRSQPLWKTRVYKDVGALAGAEPDTQLMLRVRNGCLESFTALLERYRLPVTHYLFRMVQSRAIAEELAQEVFLRVFRSRTTYEPTAKFTTWLFRIATHLALNWLRDGKRERQQESLDEQGVGGTARQVEDRRPSVEQLLLREAELREIRLAIDRLPPKQRAAILMHKYEELEYSQIAAVLGCSESAVKSLLFRAYETLRIRLAQFV
jgi:RNA polymerase sigma-70 factor (ECF subfamily)